MRRNATITTFVEGGHERNLNKMKRNGASNSNGSNNSMGERRRRTCIFDGRYYAQEYVV